jgi:hypothetical protein
MRAGWALVLVGACGAATDREGRAPEPDAAPMAEADARTPAVPADAAPRAEDRKEAGAADAHRDDGGTADAPVAAGTCAGARVCDDFEGYPVGGPPGGGWRVSTGGGSSAQMDATRAFSGSKSVRLNVAAGVNHAFVFRQGAPLFPVPGNAFYGRMMVWVTAAPPGSVHWTNVSGEGPVPGKSFTALYRYGGQRDKRFMANYYTPGAADPSDCWKQSATAIPEKRWTCFEWKFDGPGDAMSFWMDGQPVADLTVVRKGDGCTGSATAGVWEAPTFDTLRLGWGNDMSGTSIEMWLDDVVVDGKRIGCPAAKP